MLILIHIHKITAITVFEFLCKSLNSQNISISLISSLGPPIRNANCLRSARVVFLSLDYYSIRNKILLLFLFRKNLLMYIINSTDSQTE